MGWFSITTNSRGIPYLTTTNVTVSDTFVDFAVPFRRMEPIQEFNVRIANQIPADAATTLPVRLVMFGTARELTYFNGDPVTVADLEGTGVIKVFNDRVNGIFQIMSVTAPAA